MKYQKNKTIYDELQFNLNDLNGSTRVRTLYKEWDRVFGTMYGEDDEATSFTEVSSVIKETYGYSEDVAIDSIITGRSKIVAQATIRFALPVLPLRQLSYGSTSTPAR